MDYILRSPFCYFFIYLFLFFCCCYFNGVLHHSVILIWLARRRPRSLTAAGDRWTWTQNVKQNLRWYTWQNKARYAGRVILCTKRSWFSIIKAMLEPIFFLVYSITMPNITQIVTSSNQKILIAMIITIMIIIIMNKTDNWDNNYFKIVTIAIDVLIASV